MCKTFALLILMSFGLLACGDGSSPSSGASNPAATLAPTPIRISAEALQSEKQSNEVAWENKYNDNIALITGTIYSITDAGNKYDVKLETDNFTVSVVCKVDKADESIVLSLQQGQTVSALGRTSPTTAFLISWSTIAALRHPKGLCLSPADKGKRLRRHPPPLR